MIISLIELFWLGDVFHYAAVSNAARVNEELLTRWRRLRPASFATPRRSYVSLVEKDVYYFPQPYSTPCTLNV